MDAQSEANSPQLEAEEREEQIETSSSDSEDAAPMTPPLESGAADSLAKIDGAAEGIGGKEEEPIDDLENGQAQDCEATTGPDPGQLVAQQEANLINEPNVEQQDNDDEFNSISKSSLGSDFCAESASNRRLRELKLDALWEIEATCSQSKGSTQAARRLFAEMDLRALHLGSSSSLISKDDDALRTRSSVLELELDEDADNEDKETRACSSVAGEPAIGGAHWSRVTGATLSPQSGKHARTLICSLNNHDSLDDDNLDHHHVSMAHSNDSRMDHHRLIGQQEANNASENSQFSSSSGHSSAESSELGIGARSRQLNNDHAHANLYPDLERDEVDSCRTAFRENKRIIEAKQQQVKKSPQTMEEVVDGNVTATSLLISNKFSQIIDQAVKQNGISCSSCSKRLYPTDKIELDFTRLRLDIHRGCFKCRICSSLLRLETYASIDGQLYCPAHVKCAPAHQCNGGRGRLQVYI